jgi:hypothetical protein
MTKVIIGVDPHRLSATIEVVDSHEKLLADAQRAALANPTEAAETGPGGHCGATQESSAVDLPPLIDTSTASAG